MAVSEDTQAIVDAMTAQTAKLGEIVSLLQTQATQGAGVVAEVEQYLAEQRAAIENEPEPIDESVDTDFYPFARVPEGTKKSELADGSRLFTLADGTVIRALDDGMHFTVISPEGGLYDLEASRGLLELPDGREFELDADAQKVSWVEAGIEGLPGDVAPTKVDDGRYQAVLPLGYTINVLHDLQQVVIVNPIGTVNIIGLDEMRGVGENVVARAVAGNAKGFSTEKSGHFGVVESSGIVHLTLCTGREIVVRFTTDSTVPDTTGSSSGSFVCECDV